MQSEPQELPLVVLQVVRPAAGGIRQHVISLLEATNRTRVRHCIAAPRAFLDSLPAGLSVRLFPLEIAPRLAPVADVRAAGRLARLARGVDVVHAHGLRAGWIAALAHGLRSFPFVLTAHNMAAGGMLTRFAVTQIGRRADTIIAVSKAVADSLAALGMPPAKVRVVPNGIDLAHFAALPTRADARQAFGIAHDAFVVGCIARLSPEKGVDVLVQAAAELPHAQVLIAGNGPEQGALQSHLPPNVRLLGRIPDTRALLAAVDVLVIPSRMEGQGIAALEAMAAQVPIIASRVGGLAEMLTDGETGLLVPAGDAGALAQAIVHLRTSAGLPEHLTRNAAHLVRERYALPGSVAAVADIYVKAEGTNTTLG